MVSATGEFSDFQEVVRILTEKSKEAFLHDDGVVMTPRDYANYLSRISYNLRNKLNPLYVMNVIAVRNFKWYRKNRACKEGKGTSAQLTCMVHTWKPSM